MSKIIVADDDDETDRTILKYGIKHVLQTEGLEADIALVSDGTELVDQVKEGDYDLVFTDRKMPYDGLAATKDIREFNLSIPIYMVSSAPQPEAVENGANGYIIKGGNDRFNEQLKEVILRHLN